MNYPKISFVICTYNGERILDECLASLMAQDYPKAKMEVMIADGGSSDKTLEIAKKYQKQFPRTIGIYHNKAKLDAGKGGGKDTFSRKAKGEIVCLIDQDNILVQKDWIRKMIKPFENKEILGVQSRMIVPENGSTMDKYISAVGIEDPFAINYSLNAQINLHPENFEYNQEGDYYVYSADKNNFFYAGDNGFMARKKEFLEIGGYTQDIDNFYRMATAEKKVKIAIPKEARLHHKSSAELRHFLNKRGFYVRLYLVKNYDNRSFYWFSLKQNNFKQNLKFVKTVLLNLAVIPGLIQGIKMATKQKRPAWLIHPMILFLITMEYIYSFFYAITFKKEKEAGI